MKASCSNRCVFVAGADTGVGKTVLSVLLLRYLQLLGVRTSAVKPVSCGMRSDGELLHSFQSGTLGIAEVNPVHFPHPVAPWVAMEREDGVINLKTLWRHVERISRDHALTIVEGVGGVLTPFSRFTSNLTLMQQLDCPVILVVADRLGVLTQSMTAIRVLRMGGVRRIAVALVQHGGVGDESMDQNRDRLALLADGIPIFPIARLDINHCGAICWDESVKKVQKPLEGLLRFASFSAPSRSQ